MKAIVFAPDAQAEFEAAVEWYEAKAAGLGERFVSYVDEVLQLIDETPAGFAKWNIDLRFRRAVVQRFPYVVSIATLPTGLTSSLSRTEPASPDTG